MVVQIGLAALALIGAKANLGKRAKLLNNVAVTLPSEALLQPAGGMGGPVPVITPGAITSRGAIVLQPNMMSRAGVGAGQVKPNTEAPAQEGPTAKANDPLTLASKDLSDAQIEALLQKAKNWKEVEDFVGKAADPSKAPRPATAGRYRIGVSPPNGWNWCERRPRVAITRP